MKRIFFIILILLIALFGLAEIAQPEIEMKEIGLRSLPKNPQCTFYRTNADAEKTDPLLTAYHNGPERVFVSVVNPDITSFSGFSEIEMDEKKIWTAGAGRNLTFRAYSKSWTSRFFGYALKLELSEEFKVDEQVNYAGTMSVKHRSKSEKIDITGRCEA